MDRSAAAVALGLTCCLVTLLGFGPMRGNEHDVLPVAKQFVDPGWLPADWYLTRPPGYRFLFSCLAGMALKHASFATAVLAGRTLLFAAFSCASVLLCRACGVSLWLTLPWIYLYLPCQSLAAGEWILQSLETKPFAYVAVLLALGSLLRERYRAMSAWLGLAISFHLLVGFYASLCTLGCLMLPELRTRLRRPWPLLWPGLATALPGLLGLTSHLLQQSGSRRIADLGALTYVTLRVPHHVLPTTWSSRLWPVWLGLCVCLALAHRRRDARYRLLAVYMLGSAAIFGIGLGLWMVGSLAWLRFYWFRFGDTMLPLLAWLILIMRINDAASFASWPLRAARSTNALLVAATLSLYLLRAPLFVRGEDVRRGHGVPGWAPSSMHDWIRVHTPRESVFLIDPTSEDFYVGAERAVFVTYKHAPQTDAGIVEWYGRLTQVTGGHNLLRAAGSDLLSALRRGYRDLGEEQIRRIARDYPIDYVLTETATLRFDVAHRVDGWTLYKLPPRQGR